MNKNFLAQNFHKLYFKEIKIQICKIFEFLLNCRSEFFLTNAMVFFNDFSLERNKEKNFLEKQKEIYDNVTQILPNDIQEIKLENISKIMKKLDNNNFVSKTNYMKSFDEIIKKPFLECLMIAFYFNQNDKDLENSLINLLMKYCSQKETFKNLFTKVELLITNEDKILYHSLKTVVKKLNGNFFKIQVCFFLIILL